MPTLDLHIWHADRQSQSRTAGNPESDRHRSALECLFADTKTRGFDIEDTHLRDIRKLDLLMPIIALAAAWASHAADNITGTKDLPRKRHGYYAKSWFRTGFDHLRNLLQNRDMKILKTWPTHRKTWGVV